MATGGASSRLRMALAADRAVDPLTWTKTDLTDRTQTGGTIAIRRGRSGNSQEPQPSSTTVPLGNGDGALTPLYPASTYYPQLDLGVPVEIDVEAGDPTLLTTDNSGGASTPDTAVLDIVGDIAVGVEVESPLRFGGYGVTHPSLNLLKKWRTTGNNLSWLLNVGITGALSFFWTTGGSVATQGGFTSLLRLPRYDAGPAVYAIFLDVNNGAGGKTITFYAGRGTLADLIADPAAFVFDQQTTAGTTSIFSGSAPVELAINTETVDTAYFGRIRAALVVDGSLAGTQRARPDFTIQTPGATSFVDAPGRTWTLGANSDIDGHNTRLVGELVAAGPAWPGHGVANAAQVTWEIAGVLRRMRQRDEPIQSTLYRHITAPTRIANIRAYWPLEDGASALAAASPIDGVDFMNIAGAGSSWRFAQDGTLDSSKPLAHVEGTIYYSGAVPPYTGTQSRADLFFRIDTPNVSPSVTWLMGLTTSGTVAQFGVNINDTSVTITGLDAAGTSVISTTFGSDARMFGTWCLLSINLTQNGGNIDWTVDIVPIPLGVSFGTSGSVAGTVGVITYVHNWGNAAATDGGTSFGHIIVSTGQGLGWLAKADSAFAGEPAASRFDRLCREQGIPVVVDGFYGNNWPDILARGAKPMGPQRPIKLLDLLAECGIVERAVIGEARELLGLTYRSSLYNQAPVVTFTNELANPFAPTKDDQGIINDLTVTRTSAEFFRQVDQPSIDFAGPFPHNQPANTETYLQLPDLASWILRESLIPEMRVPALQIELGKNTALFPDWLAARLGDLIQSDGVPPWWPAAEVRQILTGYLEEISEPHWRVTINGTPSSVWDAGVRGDADLGLRDTGGSVLDSDFAAGSATTMDVATTLGPLWADTTASNSGLPFDLNVGGYQVPCTAIAKQGAIAFGSTGTVAHAVNASITPGLPASTAAGNLLLAWTAIRNVAGSISGNDKGYVALVTLENVTLWGKIAGAGEAAPTFTITGGVANADVSGQIVRFTGNFNTIERCLVGATAQANLAAADIAYRGIQIGESNCLVLYLGWKQDDWTSVATIAGATEIGEPSTTTGDDQGIVWDYLIETTPADIANGSFVVTGGASAISKGLVVVLRSSVQAFTVSATVFPAVAKTIPAGTAVKLWRPATRGLLTPGATGA